MKTKLDKFVVGNTPLINFKNNIFLKLESKNPTCSYKDRESLYLLKKAKSLGIDKVEIVSSGNAALSTAYFGKILGIKIKCHIPQHTSFDKKRILKELGADVEEYKGIYEEIYHKIKHNFFGYWNITPGMNKYCGEGSKTIAFEIYEQCGVPDIIMVPCGNGTVLSGIWKGFKDLQETKNLKKMPIMIGVQVENANPIYVALKKGKEFVSLKNIPDSIAEGIVAAESYSSKDAIKALKESKGEIINVNEFEIFKAYDYCLTNSIDCEPTSSTVFVALNKLKYDTFDKIVLVVTGSNKKELMKNEL